MTNTVNFNQFDLSKIIRITDVERDVGNERTIATDDAPMIGVNVQEVKIGPKIITVNFVIRGNNIEAAKHELASVLNVDTPKKLTFTDEPDKYYLAVVRGGVSVKNVVRWFQKGSIEFLVPDGVAHSTAYRKFETVKLENNK